MCVASCADALVPLPGMGRVKLRTLKELYQYGTQQGSQSTQPFIFETEEKSRSCNVCATWCSSCVRFQQVAAQVGVGIGEFTDKTNEGKKTGRCSFADSILSFPSSSTACTHRPHASSEASNVLSVSSSRDSFSENAESEATFRDSHSCKDVESLLNVRRAQPCRGSGDTPKDLTHFGYKRFSNLLEKHKELDILDDNISCISGSDSANLAIGTHYDEAYGIYCDGENFTEEPPFGEAVPNRSDQSAISSSKDLNDCAISLKGELSECSIDQVDSSVARAELSRFYSCGCATSVGTGPHLSCVKTESHLYCKKHIQKFNLGIINTIMQESTQTQQKDTKVVTEDGAIVCDICGDMGEENLLAICSKCGEGAEHVYCMRVLLQQVPEGYWMCEECMVMSGCIKSETQTVGASSLSCLPAKRRRVPLKARSAKKSRVIGVSAESPRTSNPWNRRAKATKSITSQLQISCHSQDKAKAPHGRGDKGKECILEIGSDEKRRDLETGVTFPEASKQSNQSLVSRGPLFKSSAKEKIVATRNVSFAKKSSSGFPEKPKLAKLGSQTKIAHDECSLMKSGSSKSEDLKRKVGMEKGGHLQKQKVERNLASDEIRNRKNVRTVSKSLSLKSVSSEKSNATCSEAILENDYCPVVFKNSSTAKQTKTTKGMCLPASASGVDFKDFKFKAGTVKGGRLQKQKFERNIAFDEIRKGEIVRPTSKSVSLKSVSSEKLNATYSEVFLENAYCPVVLKNSNSAEQMKPTRGKCVSKLDYPSMGLPASVTGATAAKIGNKIIPCDETFSGPNCGRLDAGQSSGQSDCRLQLYSRTTYDDLNCLLEEKKNQSRQAEQPAEAATAIKGHKLSTGLGSDERSQFEAAKLFKDIVIPKIESTWLGNFQIQSSEGIAGHCDGVQAHLSTCASQKVLEVVEKFPDIVVLEEVPRLRMWPSQFMESETTEENIALYFFAKDRHSYVRYYKKLMEYMTKNDLALKGNIDGVELLIFPSDVLPEESQCWNKLLFLWGVIRERNVNNSENTPESSSQKRESRDIASGKSLDPNANSDEDNGFGVVRCENVQGKLPIEKKNNTYNVKACRKRAMNAESDAEKVEVHGKVTMEAENNNAIDDVPWLPDHNDREAAENLILLSMGKRKRL